MKRKTFIILFALSGIAMRYSYGQGKILDDYIQSAFSQNQGLRQQHFQLDKSLYALKEAKSLFYPQVGLAGSYTKADGGRTIDVPIGDLMNPVYSTLNQLTNSQKFPQVQNQSFLLNPDNFYDVHVRTSLPLVNTEIWYANKIRKESITLQQAAVNVYKRKLVKDIKTAYYQYYQAGKAVEIYNTAQLQVQENIRVNTSFLANGVTNSTALTRAKAEQQKIAASITEAENKQRNAQAYFNFLLNRDLNAPIAIDSSIFTPEEIAPAPASAGNTRDELVQISQQQKIASLFYRQSKSYLVPKISTFLDLGSQGFNWSVDNKSRYYMWGVNLQWDLFAAGQRKYKAQQAAIDVSNLQAAYNETSISFQLEQQVAENNYRTAVANFKSAREQLLLSEKYYTDQSKVYKAGQLLYIELLDAQNQLTNAKLQLSVAFAAVQTAIADIERTQASYKL
ncbi:TolC family protein [Chitinophaga filiformis]|uniref:TolC family protein n=1 Tax=Chitinophaga filiformis TaxID=104663 RepID=UPI001F312F98|nr:TolC family protein [Chitinophaga filiformis]MCF6405832.1 TolC family protein [Chitinophaga filiformis]